MNIENLNFSVRVYNCLKRAGIDTVEQLEKMSDNDLLALRNFGVSCLAEVREKVGVAKFSQEVKQPVMTNGDRIRGMTDEELKIIISCPQEFFGLMGCPDVADCTTCKRKWLQRPAEGIHE